MAAKNSAKVIRTYLRIRPPLAKELSRGEDLDAIGVKPDDPTTCVFRPHKKKLVDGGSNNSDPTKEFQFHRCFGPDSTQDEVYQTVAQDTVQQVFEGYHGLIFVYGQTGTGKTYTIANTDPGNEGILFQSVLEVFDRIERDTEHEYETSVQYVQIYDKTVTDLLSSTHGKIKPVETDDGVELQGCSRHPVANTTDTLQLFFAGGKNAVKAATLSNPDSSRSHTIFTLDVKKTAIGSADHTATTGRLYLVDLAGCERQKVAGTEGIRLKETKDINYALLVLGMVIKALAHGTASHIPWRDHVLTRVLKYPLSGKGKTALIVTAGPSREAIEPTYGAIQFGQNAILVKEDARVHKLIDYKKLAMEYKAIIDSGAHLNGNANTEGTLTHQLKEQYENQIQTLKGEYDRALTTISDLTEVVKKMRAKYVLLKKKAQQVQQSSKARANKGTPKSGDTDGDGQTSMGTSNDGSDESNGAQASEKLMKSERARKAQKKKLIALSQEILRMDSMLLENGLQGKRDGLPLVTQQSTPPTPSQIDPVTPQRGTKRQTEEGGWSSDEDGKLEHHGSFSVTSPPMSPTTNDKLMSDQVYADTSEQLQQAIQANLVLRKENQEAANEASLLRNKANKLHAHLNVCQEDLSSKAAQVSLLEQKIEDLMQQNGEAQQKQLEIEKSKATAKMFSKIAEKVEKLRREKDEAKNELSIATNSNVKLKSRVAMLEERVSTLEGRAMESQTPFC